MLEDKEQEAQKELPTTWLVIILSFITTIMSFVVVITAMSFYQQNMKINKTDSIQFIHSNILDSLRVKEENE